MSENNCPVTQQEALSSEVGFKLYVIHHLSALNINVNSLVSERVPNLERRVGALESKHSFRAGARTAYGTVGVAAGGVLAKYCLPWIKSLFGR